MNFNPRSPWGERRGHPLPIFGLVLFQSTLPVGGATDLWGHYPKTYKISIHAPRGGSDAREKNVIQLQTIFQSTLPVGGATWQNTGNTRCFPFQSTLPVGGATWARFCWYGRRIFQSTLPVGGATLHIRLPGGGRQYFNPRSPWGERPAYGMNNVTAYNISIHAPRGGSDSKDAQFYLRIFGEKVNFECYFLVNSRCQPVS